MFCMIFIVIGNNVMRYGLLKHLTLFIFLLAIPKTLLHYADYADDDYIESKITK